MASYIENLYSKLQPKVDKNLIEINIYHVNSLNNIKTDENYDKVENINIQIITKQLLGDNNTDPKLDVFIKCSEKTYENDYCKEIRKFINTNLIKSYDQK